MKTMVAIACILYDKAADSFIPLSLIGQWRCFVYVCISDFLNLLKRISMANCDIEKFS